MTSDWDFYALRVNDEPASIFVDLGIQSEAPLDSHPNMAYIRLAMNTPRPDGLSSREEFEALIEVEKHIEATLCGEEVGYVGRNTSAGFRDFFFYTSDLPDWQSMVDSAMSRFQDYKYETDTRPDTNWSTYFDFLLPGKVDRQRIENRRVCEQLEHHGDTLTAQREIDHWCFFPTQDSLDAFLRDVAALGFQLRSTPHSNEGELTFGAQVWRVDIPSYSNIDEVTLPLFETAERYGGEYDGWESPVEA
jgi:regulator of RNase E activity RraB